MPALIALYVQQDHVVLLQVQSQSNVRLERTVMVQAAPIVLFALLATNVLKAPLPQRSVQVGMYHSVHQIFVQFVRWERMPAGILYASRVLKDLTTMSLAR